MALLGAVFIGLGVTLAIFGIFALWLPPVAALFMVPGIGLFALGRFFRRKARHDQVRRQMGDRW